MLSNKQIQDRIRSLAGKIGLDSDSAICKRCKFENRSVLGQFDRLENTPRLDTLDKFANGLGVGVQDLIYNRTDADMEMSRIWNDLSEYQKMEAIVYVKMQIREKNKPQSKAA